ncbi:MAG: hypothetical protein IPH88_19325 [Bacteroidales bacterium]|nr:hypothetical protein [Bacteroidales bacterium]
MKPEEIEVKRKYEELKIESDKKMKAINNAFKLSIEQADIAFKMLSMKRQWNITLMRLSKSGSDTREK